MEHEGGGDINCYRCTCNKPQMLSERTERLRNQRTRGDHQDYRIITIGLKSPGDLRRLTCYHWDSSERPSANVWVKKSQRSIIIIIIIIIFYLLLLLLLLLVWVIYDEVSSLGDRGENVYCWSRVCPTFIFLFPRAF